MKKIPPVYTSNTNISMAFLYSEWIPREKPEAREINDIDNNYRFVLASENDRPFVDVNATI